MSNQLEAVQLRVMLNVQILAKNGWHFEYDDMGQQFLVSASDKQLANRDRIIRVITTALEAATLTDDSLAWHIAALDDTSTDDDE